MHICAKFQIVNSNQTKRYLVSDVRVYMIHFLTIYSLIWYINIKTGLYHVASSSRPILGWKVTCCTSQSQIWIFRLLDCPPTTHFQVSHLSFRAWLCDVIFKYIDLHMHSTLFLYLELNLWYAGYNAWMFWHGIPHWEVCYFPQRQIDDCPMN